MDKAIARVNKGRNTDLKGLILQPFIWSRRVFQTHFGISVPIFNNINSKIYLRNIFKISKEKDNENLMFKKVLLLNSHPNLSI